MVPISDIPDLCLLALFKQLPLKDQMTASRVCFRWQSLIFSITRHRKSLTFFLGDDSTANFEHSLHSQSILNLLVAEDGTTILYPTFRASAWNTLHYIELDQFTVNQIVTTFPAIKELRITLTTETLNLFEGVIALLVQWRTVLRKLRLRSDFHFYPELLVDNIFAALNSLSSLKSLALYLHHLPLRQLTILPNLEVLKYRSMRATPEQFATMLRYADAATEDGLQCHIHYFSWTSGVTQYPHFTALPERICSRFLMLAFRNPPIRDVTSLTAVFRGIQVLVLNPSGITIRYLFQCIAQLPNLFYLFLKIAFSTMIPDDRPHLMLPQLHPVKAFRLQCVSRSHADLQGLALDWTMPALQVVEFTFKRRCRCADCGVLSFEVNYLEDNVTRVRRCLAVVFGHLRRNCAHLRTILYNRQEILGSADQLLLERMEEQ